MIFFRKKEAAKDRKIFLHLFLCVCVKKDKKFSITVSEEEGAKLHVVAAAAAAG